MKDATTTTAQKVRSLTSDHPEHAEEDQDDQHGEEHTEGAHGSALVRGETGQALARCGQDR